MENLSHEMAITANKIGVPSYAGDLIHDAMTINGAKVGDIYYWVFKGNGCGTWMGHKDFPYLAVYFLDEVKAVYEIQVLETGEGYGFPKGTLTKKEFRLESSEHNKTPTVVFM
jgi:hypothetical protein